MCPSYVCTQGSNVIFFDPKREDRSIQHLETFIGQKFKLRPVPNQSAVSAHRGNSAAELVLAVAPELALSMKAAADGLRAKAKEDPSADLLASALVLLALGGEQQALPSFSVVTGAPGVQTLKVQADFINPKEIETAIRAVIPNENLEVIPSGYVFLLPLPLFSFALPAVRSGGSSDVHQLTRFALCAFC